MIVALALFIAEPVRPPPPPADQQAEAGELAQLMLGAPELIAVLRARFEAQVAGVMDHPADGSSNADIPPALRQQLVGAEGDDYVAALHAELPRPLAAMQTAYAQGLAKYELDRLTEYLRTTGGRKFLAFIFRIAPGRSDGTVSREEAGAALIKELTPAELADMQAAMEPALLAHWKAAIAVAQPALRAWGEAAAARTAKHADAIGHQVGRDYYRVHPPK